MLLWIIRAFFIVIIAAVLLVNLTDPVISGGAGRTDFFALLWCALALVCCSFFIDFTAPKKSLAALAGVFFGLLVGIVISWALAQVLDMIVDIYRIELNLTAIRALKWMLGISICFLIIIYR